MKGYVRILLVWSLAALFSVSLLAVAQADQSSVNLLTPNQATIEWDTGGFRPATGGGTQPAVTQDTSRAWEGSASLHVKGDGSATRQGIWMASTFVPDHRASYTFSGYIYGEAGTEVMVTYEEKGANGAGVVIEHTSDVFVLTGEWQRFTFTADMVAGDSLGVTVRHMKAEPFEFWLDGLQLEKGDSASAWQAPIQGKNLLTFNQATVETDTRGFVPATGGGRPTWLARDVQQAWEGEASLHIEGDGSAVGQGVWMWPAFLPDTRGVYTISLYVKGEAGDVFYLTAEEKGDMGTGLARAVNSEPVVLTGGWDRLSVTIRMEEGTRLNPVLRHATDEPFNVWIDGIQIEQGPTATEWEAPPRY